MLFGMIKPNADTKSIYFNYILNNNNDNTNA